VKDGSLKQSKGNSFDETPCSFLSNAIHLQFGRIQGTLLGPNISADGKDR